MMNRRITALLMAVALVLIGFVPVRGASYNVRVFELFGGNTDSTEQMSQWFPVRNANHVHIRAWSTHAAYSLATGADSLFSDSISTFKIGLTDTVVMVKVLSGSDTLRLVAAVDSIQYSPTAVDTITKLVRFDHSFVNKQLRSPANGGGIWSVVTCASAGSVSASSDFGINSAYMRVYVTPLRRNTNVSTTPTRVTGLKGLRMTAYVYYNDSR